ncbi:carbohydrate ABC transporter substrate-binding protein (CUT1 family) [Herbihabitans rhizosphaerae]|uniref:Carbohydrate ABC transporter substrate-binding protein (CUT1 family) n=1 Tax=Herbihabitans rhizosphaerae TaxID=1872711 RepID=A0A4V2ERB9_9PSEU|nr:extracellular solute-binding protein [Herbihabitans rhizosphaerae]RZS30312.1 carbohydrate ABC transporter substrate-binding protein (CUT1 family) [Herbihabitans rhizosphaerae]
MRRAAAVGFALTAVLLAGCSPGSSDDGGGGGGAPNKLVFVTFTDGPDKATTEALVKQFERDNGVTVELQFLPFSELEQQLQGRLASNNVPDVIRTQNLQPFRDDLLDLKSAGQDVANQYLDEAQKAIKNKDGAAVALPSDLTMNGPMVNKDAFAKAGIPLPPVDKPWTWDELITNAKAAQKAVGSPFAIAYDKSGHRLSSMLNQYGTDFYGADGKVALDQGKATAALGKFVELTQQNAISKDFWIESGTKYKGANDIFISGDAPLYISGNWQVGQFDKAIKFNWAAIPNPCAARCGGYPGGKFMAAFKRSANPPLAAKLVAFMNSRAAQEKFAIEAQFLPTRKDLIAEGVKYAVRPADMAVFLADVKRTDPASYASNYNPGFSPTATELVKQLARSIAGQQSIGDTVNAVRTAAQKNLDAAGK